MTSVMVESLPMIEMGWGSKPSFIEITRDEVIFRFRRSAIPSASGQVGERKTG